MTQEKKAVFILAQVLIRSFFLIKNKTKIQKNKFISVGDYEINKDDNVENFNNKFFNYGFFSNVLEDENKIVILIKFIYLIFIFLSLN